MTYKPGHFTSVQAAWPGLRDYVCTATDKVSATTKPAHATREKGMHEGEFWATGRVLMGGTPKHDAPGWMGKK